MTSNSTWIKMGKEQRARWRVNGVLDSNPMISGSKIRTHTHYISSCCGMEADDMKWNACCLLPCDLFSIPAPPPWTRLTSVQLGLSIPEHPSQKRLVVLWQQLSSLRYSRGVCYGLVRFVSLWSLVCVMFATLSFDGNTPPDQIQRPCGKALSKSMGKLEWKPEPFWAMNLLRCDFTLCWVNLAFQAVSNLMFQTPNELCKCHNG